MHSKYLSFCGVHTCCHLHGSSSVQAHALRSPAARLHGPTCRRGSQACVLQGMKGAVDVLYNVTREQPCHKLELTGPAGGPGLQTYLYLWCTQAVGQEVGAGSAKTMRA